MTAKRRQQNAWGISEARAHISDLFEAAIAKGPQRVTRRDNRTVVVVSEADYARLGERRGSFADYLLNCPIDPDDLPRRRPARAARAPDR